MTDQRPYEVCSQWTIVMVSSVRMETKTYLYLPVQKHELVYIYVLSEIMSLSKRLTG